MSGHIKGPWRIAVFHNETTIEADSQTVCTNVSNCDAYLISAAPDLLEALEACADSLREYHQMSKPPVKGRLGKELRNAEAALKKAKP